MYVPTRKFLGRQYRFKAETTPEEAHAVSQEFIDKAFAVTEVLSTFGLDLNIQRRIADYWAPKLKNPHIYEGWRKHLKE